MSLEDNMEVQHNNFEASSALQIRVKLIKI